MDRLIELMRRLCLVGIWGYALIFIFLAVSSGSLVFLVGVLFAAWVLSTASNWIFGRKNSPSSNKINYSQKFIRAAKFLAKWIGERPNEDGMGTFSYWIVLIIYTIVMLMIMLPIVLVLIVFEIIKEMILDLTASYQDNDTEKTKN